MTATTPRPGDTITTADQLNDLPLGSVVEDKHDDIAFHISRGEWAFTESAALGSRYVTKRFAPLTVLYVPGEQPSPSVEDARAAEVLAAHQRQSIGMTASSPDHCSCGEAVPPEPDLTTSGPALTIEGRRYRAFAAHQAAALAASRAVPSHSIGWGAQGRPEGILDQPAVPSDQGEYTRDTDPYLPAVPSDHTATTEDAAVEDIAIEAAAQAIYPEVMGTWEDQWPDWEHADDQAKEFMRSLARDALLAAAGLLATSRPDTTTEWGVRLDPHDGEGDVRSHPDQASAEQAHRVDQQWFADHTAPEWKTAWARSVLVRREVTAWTEADQ